MGLVVKRVAWTPEAERLGEGDRSKAPAHPSWELPDELWEVLEPLVTPRASRGRPREVEDLRRIAAGVFSVLRTGIQWQAVPRALYGPPSTVWYYFNKWARAEVFKKVWAKALGVYDELVEVEWEWQSVDGAMTKAPLGGEKTGANPTDRGKRGTKRSVLTEGKGIPLAVVVAGANRHDMKLLEATLDAIVIEQPEATPGILDRAFELLPRLSHRRTRSAC